MSTTESAAEPDGTKGLQAAVRWLRQQAFDHRDRGLCWTVEEGSHVRAFDERAAQDYMAAATRIEAMLNT